MKPTNKLKIINDPIYGFITLPGELLFQLIEHRYFQRLRRISQMGMSYIVYPGAHHTRFQHALGAMFLMQKAVYALRTKGIQISEAEHEALLVAILLHDIGHGPFSHAMEHSIVEDVDHEYLSLAFMKKLNEECNGALDTAIAIFTNRYPRKFMHQLVSGQLDMDRLDYLRRDSFYTGVSEGAVNTERLITMLNVHDDTLVVEEKGIYSVEKFIVARRLMYWQVYLHKTSLVAEQLLLRLLKRAKEVTQAGATLPATPALQFFLTTTITKRTFSSEVLEQFSKLDDYDIVSAIKMWVSAEDTVLRTIAKMLLNRDLLKVKLKKNPVTVARMHSKKRALMQRDHLSEAEASYFVFQGEISNLAYRMDHNAIHLLKKNGKMIDVAKASDQLNIEALSKTVIKYYLCYPKSL
ncbi:HD domain-containing protein [Altibacter sp. HG106]|uniref:HD domain-containing protein n=1 Tax=Altibacter sp. HG106 TaxID=3023937 RepID=UPI00234FC34F|nr:HD domain-containing protein [Altibacter sp. HG106]MDC7993608.1 HD domain-containing protein [Altibacter sp. HG106]